MKRPSPLPRRKTQRHWPHGTDVASPPTRRPRQRSARSAVRRHDPAAPTERKLTEGCLFRRFSSLHLLLGARIGCGLPGERNLCTLTVRLRASNVLVGPSNRPSQHCRVESPRWMKSKLSHLTLARRVGPQAIARRISHLQFDPFRMAVVNSGVFLALSLVVWLFDLTYVPLSAGIALLFFFGSVAAFVLFVRSGGGLAAVSFFVLGAGVFFGFGAFYSTVSATISRSCCSRRKSNSRCFRS